LIIESLLDTDLYKFTMMQVVLHQFPGAMVEYQFKCRAPDVDLSPYADEIQQEIKAYCQLRFTEDELAYLNQLSYLKTDFIEFLRIFKANPDFIEIQTKPEFRLTVRGPWLHTIMFEVPVLAIISEVYFRNTAPGLDMTEGKQRLQDKIDFVKTNLMAGEFKFSDFGTRRRFSREWQAFVVEQLSSQLSGYMTGTSNVFLAKQFNLKPIGTMAHEYIQACQALGPRLAQSQRFAFQCWAQEYRGDLGIALSDTLSIDAFLNDFDLYFCKLFDGARQDSGDPISWGERMLDHYAKMKIDSKTKTLVFSDSLSFEKARDIHEHFFPKTNPVFGIGTNLTNDVGSHPLDMVIKMTRCNDQPVAKISDAEGKTMCEDASYLSYLKKVFKIASQP
jgi:nicotinate phosphoribosyltransferase